jgi:hypothetical protein
MATLVCGKYVEWSPSGVPAGMVQVAPSQRRTAERSPVVQVSHSSPPGAAVICGIVR